LSAVLISCYHSITRIISFTKNGSKQRSSVSEYGPWYRLMIPQSRQSTRCFLQSSELGPPPHHPLTRRRVCPRLVPGWGGHTRLRERGVGGPNFDEGIDTVELMIYMYYVEDTFRFAFVLATKIGTSLLGNHLTLKAQPDLRYSQQ
jgi:hypothetical protein